MSFIDRLRSQPPGRQLALGAAVLVTLTALLVAVYWFGLRTDYKVLFAHLRPVDAAAVVADLDKRKTPYRLADEGTTILVPAKLADATRLAVSSQDLPLKGVVGFELFNKSDMGLTEFAQRINFRRALEGELERTIMSLDGVEGARVHLALAEPTVFKDDRKPSRASVTLIPQAGGTLSPDTVLGVQRLVAAAATDLDMADVVVLDRTGAVVSGAAFPDAPASPPSVGEKGGVEQYYAARIRAALASLYPDDRLQVSVLAEPASAATGDPFAAWSPSARSFGLHVMIRLAAPVGPQVRDQVLAAAATAVGPAAAGDTLNLSFDPPPAIPSGRQTAAAPSPALRSLDLASPRISVLVAAAALLIALAAAAAWLHRRRDGPARLSAARRRDLARQLAALLPNEEGHVADRI